MMMWPDSLEFFYHLKQQDGFLITPSGSTQRHLQLVDFQTDNFSQCIDPEFYNSLIGE